MPKAACSSLKKLMAISLGLSLPTRNIHQSIHELDFPYAPSFRRYAGTIYRPFFRFTFVRNPFTRLASCYLDKIAPTRDLNDDYFRNGVQLCFSEFPQFHAGMSFRKFIEVVANIPDHLAEPHFQAQSYLTHRNGRPIVDFIGKVEQFKEDIQPVLDHLRVDIDPSQLFENRARRGWDADLYDEEIVRLVRNRYRDDFELLGYSPGFEFG
jgi:hypothetical protein